MGLELFELCKEFRHSRPIWVPWTPFYDYHGIYLKFDLFINKNGRTKDFDFSIESCIQQLRPLKHHSNLFNISRNLIFLDIVLMEIVLLISLNHFSNFMEIGETSWVWGCAQPLLAWSLESKTLLWHGTWEMMTSVRMLLKLGSTLVIWSTEFLPID